MFFSSVRALLWAALWGTIIVTLPLVTRAQDTVLVAEELEQSRKLNEAKREATIAANVEFTMEEKSKFWPLFWEYRSKVSEIDDAYVRVLGEYENSYQSMSDAKARDISGTWLQIELDRYNLKKQYFEKFESVLPAAKTLRVMQIENKLNVMSDASVGKQIPLVIPRQ